MSLPGPRTAAGDSRPGPAPRGVEYQYRRLDPTAGNRSNRLHHPARAKSVMEQPVVARRARRAAERYGKDIGFLLGQVTRRLALGELAPGPLPLLAPAAGALGSILRCAAWPAGEAPGKVILAERVLSAVPAPVAKAAYRA